jgi:hypothetical protein
MPNLTSLGRVFVYDGIKIMRDLPNANGPDK